MRKKDAVAEKTLAKIRKEEDKLAGLELKKKNWKIKSRNARLVLQNCESRKSVRSWKLSLN